MDMKQRKRILLLEDELLIAMQLELLIEDFGCAIVGPVASCPAALYLLKSEEIDAAILDLVVRDEHCDSVADELDANGIPWALSTACDVSVLDPRYRSVPLVAKPFMESEVRLILQELLNPLA